MDSINVDSVEIGSKAPDFELQTEKGERWRLSDHLGTVVALLFYPKDETVHCTKQLCSVRDNWADYLKTKALIVGISRGTIEEHQKFSQHYDLPIKLLADPNKSVTKIYSSHAILPIIFTRGVVIIDAKGIIRTRDVMFSAFRPIDQKVISSIYAARTEFLDEKYESLRFKR
jgi:thioredoxin-dependent peroxiredoxin